jgi:Protein of unknown function (DUF4246)
VQIRALRSDPSRGSGDNEHQAHIKCSIISYINNLHPHCHKDLYCVIEDIIAAAIPLWNETLLAHERQARSPRIPYTQVVYDPDPETLPDKLVWDGTNDQEYSAWLDNARKNGLVHPEPEEFRPPKKTEAQSLPFVERYSSSGLQVIVKLATIELSPSNPRYSGGVWHVEGQLNEHICATALYYYDSENITESRLGFRQLSDIDAYFGSGLVPDIQYEQNDSTFLEPIFGCVDREAAIQEVGSVLCKEGRLLTFPNTLQHRVLPFELADKSKPGHRKILALFLVDPNLHIISTASVPPQRRDWFLEQAGLDGGIGGLTEDLFERVLGTIDFPLSMEQAHAFRLELMEERKSFEISNSTALEYIVISLCEH